MTETVTDQLYIYCLQTDSCKLLIDCMQGRIKGNVGHKHFSNCRPFFPKKGED